MQAINACHATVTEKMDHVYLELGYIHIDMDTFQGRLMEAEQQISVMRMCRDHLAGIHTLKVKVKHLESHAEDAENCKQHNNLRIRGL